MFNAARPPSVLMTQASCNYCILYDLLQRFNYQNNILPSHLRKCRWYQRLDPLEIKKPLSRYLPQRHTLICHDLTPVIGGLLTAPRGHHHFLARTSLTATAFFPFMWCDKSRLCVMGGKEWKQIETLQQEHI